MVSIIHVNGTGRSVSMIQHKKLAFRRHTFIEPLQYIYLYTCFWNICCSWFQLWHDIFRNWHYAALNITSLTLDTSSSHKCCLMPPQILIQNVEQFQALRNFGGDIGDIEKSFINLSLHCLRKKDHVKTTHFWETKLHGWWHCDKHNYGCTRYASRCW